MFANNNAVNLEAVMSCPLAKRTVAHEVVMAQMGHYNLEHSYLTDNNGTRINPKNNINVKGRFLRPTNKDIFFVKASFSDACVGKDLSVFAERMRGACYCYNSRTLMVAVFCCEGSKEDRKQLKPIQDSFNAELKVCSGVRIGNKNLIISGRPEVMTVYEIANQIGYEGWLTPKPFVDMGNFAKAIDKDTIPPVLLKIAKSIGERGNNNLDYLVSTNMGLIGAVLAQDFRVAVYQDGANYYSPNIWVMNLGHPASGKSPAMKNAFENAQKCVYTRNETLERHKDMASQASDGRVKKYLNNILSDDEDNKKIESYSSTDEVVEECERRLKSVLPPEADGRGIYMTTDATLAALYKVMQLGRPIAYIVDEGGSFFKELEGKNSTSAALRAVFLNSESGTGHINVTRATKDDKSIKNAAVSVIVGIQPDVFAPFISNAEAGIGNDGLINRFQFMVMPVTPFAEAIDSSVFQKLQTITSGKFFDALSNWAPKSEANCMGDHLLVHFSTDAQLEYSEWLKELKMQRTKYNSRHLMHSQLGKYEVLAAKLGLIYQVALNYDPDTQTFSPVKNISKEAFSYVKNTINYLMSHAMTIFGVEGVGIAQQEQAKCLLLKLQKKAEKNVSMTISEMVQCNWKNFAGRGDDAREAITDSLHYLEKMGIVKPVGKNNTHVWHLNPKAMWL